MPEITMLYAGLTAALFALLSTLAAVKRGATDTPYGDGGNVGLGLALRRFGNLAEYGAMAIVVLLLLELSSPPPFVLHLYGVLFIAFRLIHPVSLFADPSSPILLKIDRFISAAGTALLLLVGGAQLLVTAI